MGGGGGVRLGKATQSRDIARKFDDALVIDVIQHAMRSRTAGAPGGLGGRRPAAYIRRELAEKQSGSLLGDAEPPPGFVVLGVRRFAARLPVTLRPLEEPVERSRNGRAHQIPPPGQAFRQ